MEQDLIIGKYTLESLTNGMYASPLDLYREYIQNAVDAIDEAIRTNIEDPEKFLISINVNQEQRTIKIRDNGTGIKKKEAIKYLIDIGNSTKDRKKSRGFRGIGRLAALGYCDILAFTTSYRDEMCKTRVIFDAKELGRLLGDRMSEENSVTAVLEKVISVEISQEKLKEHYFSVEIEGVHNVNKLLDLENVKKYLLQHAPLRYAPTFKWQNPIISKMKALGYVVPVYNIQLNGEYLFKPYQDMFIADRVKKSSDVIKDIEVIPFYRDGKISAILWHAISNYYGTINDNSIKGIRIRQGNILIGNKFSCNSFFKEERFNGWLIGEIHIIDDELIANARRDDFEKNNAYYSLVENIKEWSSRQSKEIRRVSCDRSLSVEKKAVVDAKQMDDINDLFDETIEIMDYFGESDFMEKGESESIAEEDYIGKLSLLLDQKKMQTKYIALNINSRLTVEHKKVLERVFDLIVQEYDKEDAERFINVISERF